MILIALYCLFKLLFRRTVVLLRRVEKEYKCDQRQRAVKGAQDEPSREGMYTEVNGIQVKAERRFLTAERANRFSFKIEIMDNS